jgi:hypothetical protein
VRRVEGAHKGLGDETDEPYPGTFTDVPERWRDHKPFRRRQAAKREWLEAQWWRRPFDRRRWAVRSLRSPGPLAVLGDVRVLGSFVSGARESAQSPC